MLVFAEGKREVTLQEPERCLHAALRGELVLTDDDAEVRSISAGGRLQVVELRGDTERSLLVTAAPNGSLTYAYAYAGAAAPFDRTARFWLAGFLPVLIEEAGMGGAARAERLYRQGGISAVLDEVRRLKGEHVRRAHLEGIVQRVDLPAGEMISVIHVVSEALPSDGDRASLLVRLAERGTAAVREEIHTAATQIRSPADRRAVLQALATVEPPEQQRK